MFLADPVERGPKSALIPGGTDAEEVRDRDVGIPLETLTSVDAQGDGGGKSGDFGDGQCCEEEAR